MSTVLIHGLTARTEAIPNWPEGPFQIRDFPILYSAARVQIEHLKSYAAALGQLRDLGADDQAQLDTWAAEFFKIDAYRKPIAWRPAAAKVALEICYAHCTVRLHGENFHQEMARIRANS
jgi:hypothetical protein